MRKIVLFATFLVLLVLSVQTYVPVSIERQRQSLVSISERRTVVLNLPDSQFLYLCPTIGADTLSSVGMTSDEASIAFSSLGFFVDPRGVVQSCVPDTMSLQPHLDTASVRSLLSSEVSRLAHRRDVVANYIEEIEYYIDTHSAIDDGYSQVENLLAECQRDVLHTDSLLVLLTLALETDFSEPTLLRIAEIKYTTPVDSVTRSFPATITARPDQWQLTMGRMPQGAYFYNLGQLTWWGSERDTLGVVQGSPVVDSRGAVRGVLGNPTYKSRFRFSPRLSFQYVWQWWRWLFSSKESDCPLPEVERFETRDTLNAKYIGRWNADTLAFYQRQVGDTLYQGEFNTSLQYHGTGSLIHRNTFYTGEWKNGMRDGFGISLDSGRTVRCGIWANDVFRGEQMLYTRDRVYGIDISRYQHEIKRRRYNIAWKNLRITSLGRNRNHRIDGEVDFPISFCYIKATQGTSISNRYYMADARAARAQGIIVGAYHFFSPTKGIAQANYFMRMARPQRGDLPPVLDVELTNRQVAKMGGRARMQREMLAWLRTVKARTGTTPILYLSQQFIKRHLHDAPAELMSYPVWIARYSEYKPSMHLLFWQLSPDGRVRGITGEVDIDVFNGNMDQFRSFCEEKGVR